VRGCSAPQPQTFQRVRALYVAAVLSLTACSGSFGEGAREAFHQALASGPAPAVQIDNVAGTVRVEGWEKPTVDVAATKYAHDSDALRTVVIGVRKEGDKIFIATTYTGQTHTGGVRYRVSVPADAALAIRNVAGTVDVSRVRGDIDVGTQAGEITVNAGRVGGNRSIDLRATTGAITLVIAPGSNATVVARSTIGQIESDVPGLSQRRDNLLGASGGGTIGTGSASVRLTTTTGAISVRQLAI
jgi:hypothetical protein